MKNSASYAGATLERKAAAFCTHAAIRGPVSAGRRHRALTDRHFAALMDQLAPRIRHLTRIYGLSMHAEDAHQACAIGLYRALETYDPEKSRFTTHVTWQMRGELQSLRHRVHLDHRQSARTAGVRTVSLDAMYEPNREGAAWEIVDESALAQTEAGASEALALALFNRLWEAQNSRSSKPTDAVQQAAERRIVRASLWGRENEMSGDRTPEQTRQVVRRNWRNCARGLAA